MCRINISLSNKLCFKIEETYISRTYKIHTVFVTVTVAYGHTTLNVPDLGSQAGLGLVSIWMADCLGIPGAVKFFSTTCMSFVETSDHLMTHQEASAAADLLADTSVSFWLSVSMLLILDLLRCPRSLLALILIHLTLS